jgi:hypothetical protein
MLPRLPPSLEIAIRGAAGVICVQWRQAMMTGRVKRWSGRSRRAEAGWGGRDPRPQRDRSRGSPAPVAPKNLENFLQTPSGSLVQPEWSTAIALGIDE